MNTDHIRNFCIIAHIDHGKSTLADRLLEFTGTVAKRDMQEQLLDSNPIERERGITIKLAPVRMIYHAKNHKFQIPNSNNKNSLYPGVCDLNIANLEQKFVLNLIDTPGHVDFSYEVSRSLAACEGAVLVVDCTQGVQAQTLANLTLARKQNLKIIPVLNKIDLPNAQIEKTRQQICDLGFKNEEIIEISAKTGQNIDKLLFAIIQRIPPPADNGSNSLTTRPLRALIFSSQYDQHKGIVVYVRIIDGELEFTPQKEIEFLASKTTVHPIEIGYFLPQMSSCTTLHTGEVGYIATGLKDARLAKVGDTIISNRMPNDKFQMINSKKSLDIDIIALSGYKEPKPMVFLGLFPIQSQDLNQARDALSKLHLSDSSFTFKPIFSLALGNGFHSGFLGLLHAEVVQERLLREFNLSLLATAPNVEYRIKLKTNNLQLTTDNSQLIIQSAAEFPDPSTIEASFEPMMQVTIFSPKNYVGSIMQLCQDKRGEYIDLVYVSEQAQFTYLIPLSEMIIDFFDNLKSITQGYASIDYEFFDYQEVSLVKVDILLNHEKVDAFSQLTVSDKAQSFGKKIVEKLAEVIPKQQFVIPIQAAIGGQIIARADVKPFRKDVIQKLYGGDRTRKDKLLEAQKKGKKKMKMVGRVEVPQEAFLQIFKR